MKFILLILLFITTVFSQDLQKVSLQLQWKHQFEFAGFYAAKEKGFYKDAGLDVELIEYDNKGSVTEKVLKGNATFGVTYASIIAEYLNNKPLVLMANFFKQSPLVLIAQEDILTPAQLKGKKVMGVSDSIDNITLATMLNKFGVFKEDMKNIEPSFNINDFINKKVDAMSVFTTNELFELNAKGIKYNIFDPTAYGTKYYDVNLFTTKKEATNNPKRVQKFKEASIKGWEYALKHKSEIVELILKKYNTQNRTRDALMFEAIQIEQIMLANIYKIGSIDKFRIKLIADNFVQSGFIKENKAITDKNLDAFIFNDYKNKLITINFTEVEKEFIKKHKKIRLAHIKFWHTDNNFMYKHIESKYSQLLNKYSGLNISLVNFEAWSDAYEKAIDGNIVDGILYLSYTKEREKKYFNYMPPYSNAPAFLIVKNENSDIKQLSDLSGKSIYTLKNSVTNNIIDDFKLNIKTIKVNKKKELIAILSSQDIKAQAILTYDYDIKELEQYGLKVAKIIYSKYAEVHIGLSKKHPILQSILTKAHNFIPKEEFWKIEKESYMELLKEEKKIKLRPEEQEYLKSKKEIKMCVDPDWLPLEKIENGKYIGIGSDYMRLFSKKLHIPIVLVPTTTWNESLEKIKNRECDILPVAEKTPIREKYVDFTRPYIEIAKVFATKIGVTFFDDITDILDKKIGIVKGYAFIEILKNEYPNINIVEVDSLENGLQMVENGTIFAYLDNAIVINSKILEKYIGTVAISGKMKNKHRLSIATRNDEKTLNTIFNKLIFSVDIATKEKIFNNWVNISKKEKIDYSLVFQILVASFLIFLIFLYSNLQLRKEIKKRKLVEKNLQESENKLEEKVKIEVQKNEKNQLLIMEQSKLVQMGEMIENIAHQWRQPLAQINAAVLMTDVILEKNSFKNDGVEERLLEIESLTKYMSNTIDDFRNYVQQGNPKVPFSLAKVTNDSIKILKGSLESHYIKVHLDVDTQLSYFGYPNELQQVMVVLLSNAKDILVSKEIKNPEIRVNIRENSENFIISVCDNAGGIKVENLDKVFAPYFTTKHKTQGTGLGLYMSKMIIENGFKGKLTAQNREHGACFKIILYKEELIDD